MSSERSIRSRDSDASSGTAATTNSRLRRPPDGKNDADKAAWFHARHQDASGRRRAPAPIYRDDYDEEDDYEEPEATDIWSPNKRTAAQASHSPTPGGVYATAKRGRGGGMSGRGSGTRGRKSAFERSYWRQEDEPTPPAKRRRHVTPSLYAGEPPDMMEYQPPPAGAYARPKSSIQRRLDFEARPSSSRGVNRAQMQHQHRLTGSASYSQTPSPTTPGVQGAGSSSPYISAFSGPLGMSASRGGQRYSPGASSQASSSDMAGTSGSGMMSHNSKLLSSLMQAAAEPKPGAPSIVKLPPKEEVRKLLETFLSFFLSVFKNYLYIPPSSRIPSTNRTNSSNRI